jgi:hypothetical protein
MDFRNSAGFLEQCLEQWELIVTSNKLLSTTAANKYYMKMMKSKFRTIKKELEVEATCEGFMLKSPPLGRKKQQPMKKTLGMSEAAPLQSTPTEFTFKIPEKIRVTKRSYSQIEVGIQKDQPVPKKSPIFKKPEELSIPSVEGTLLCRTPSLAFIFPPKSQKTSKRRRSDMECKEDQRDQKELSVSKGASEGVPVHRTKSEPLLPYCQELESKDQKDSTFEQDECEDYSNSSLFTQVFYNKQFDLPQSPVISQPSLVQKT